MVYRDNHGQNFETNFLSEIANYGKTSMFIFYGFFGSVDKIFILGRRLMAGL